MEQVTNLTTWKKLLETIESSENKNDPKIFDELANLLEHLVPQTVPRLQKDYESCTLKSFLLFGELVDKIDLSDKPLLCAFLRMLTSFGYLRVAQITYYPEGPRDLEPDTAYFPTIEKVKWYDLTPLLPEAGTIGWKAIMTHGIVKEEQELQQVCLGLLSQKLHFYSIVKSLDRYRSTAAVIERNGQRVAEKLFELIRDVAYDDDNLIGLDVPLFNLLLPFTDEDQQAAIIEALVEDLFKPFMLQKEISDEEWSKLFELIAVCVMSKANLQNLLVTKLLNHLKCNIIRRKRRHSVEGVPENGQTTLGSLLGDINEGKNLVELLGKLDEAESLSRKSLQTAYISNWVKVLSRIAAHRTMLTTSSQKIIVAGSILLVTASSIIEQDLIRDISCLMANTAENTIFPGKLLIACNSGFLIDLTRHLCNRTDILETFDSPILLFYKSLVSHHFRFLFARGNLEIENFIAFICDGSLGKNQSHMLQYTCVRELAQLLESIKNRSSSKAIEIFMSCSRAISKKLLKFIKRNLPSHDEEVEATYLDDSNDSLKNLVVIDALACILKIAVERKDQEILDAYGDLLLKLYSQTTSRVKSLVSATQVGKSEILCPLDSNLTRLLILYTDHKEMIKPYLNYDLLETMSQILVKENGKLNADTEAKMNKKLIYNQIKKKLEELDQMANKATGVYQTIINKQYNSVVDQIIGSASNLGNEKSCLLPQMGTLREVSTILLSRCDSKTYKRILEHTVDFLELCDPLDHPRVLYFFLILESLTPKQPQHTKEPSDFLQSFQETLPKISCALIRISKSIELGPSIHAFTRPGSHNSNRAIQCCTYSNCIQIYSHIISSFPPKSTNSVITDAMELCVSSNLMQYSKHSTKLHGFFIQLASAIVGLLKAICIGRKEGDILKSSMPIFLSVFSNLIRCLILSSDIQKLEVIPRLATNGHSRDGENHDTEMNKTPDATRRKYESQLELLALDVGRSLNNLSFLKVKLVDYAPHLISTYVKDVQRASCPDFVRNHLEEGIFRIFNTIDAYQKERREEVLEVGAQRKTSAGKASGSLFEMIHARLDQASREIFRDMHDNYNKFHRYLGKC